MLTGTSSIKIGQSRARSWRLSSNASLNQGRPCEWSTPCTCCESTALRLGEPFSLTRPHLWTPWGHTLPNHTLIIDTINFPCPGDKLPKHTLIIDTTNFPRPLSDVCSSSASQTGQPGAERGRKTAVHRVACFDNKACFSCVHGICMDMFCIRACCCICTCKHMRMYLCMHNAQYFNLRTAWLCSAHN